MGKDIYPQWLNLTELTINSTTIVVSETNTPKMNDNQVMEILKVQYEANMPILSSVGAVSGDETNELLLAIVKGSNPGTTTMLRLNNEKIIDYLRIKEETQYAEATETGGAGIVTQNIIIHDLTDGGGKGFLVATEKIYIQGLGANATMVEKQRVRILYRIVSVSSAELLAMARQ